MLKELNYLSDSESSFYNNENIFNEVIYDSETKNSYIINIIETKDNQLKSILKNFEKSDHFITDNDINNDNREKRKKDMLIFCLSLLIIILIETPLMICDLIYGYYDDKCITNKPTNLNITMGLYLRVSGFTRLFNLIFVTVFSACFSESIIKFYSECSLILFYSYIVNLFYLIWNIIGSLIYWCFIYDKYNIKCSSSVYTYLFVSLIFKIVYNLYLIVSIKYK